LVAQASKPAVSPVSKPARHAISFNDLTSSTIEPPFVISWLFVWFVGKSLSKKIFCSGVVECCLLLFIVVQRCLLLFIVVSPTAGHFALFAVSRFMTQVHRRFWFLKSSLWCFSGALSFEFGISPIRHLGPSYLCSSVVSVPAFFVFIRVIRGHAASHTRIPSQFPKITNLTVRNSGKPKGFGAFSPSCRRPFYHFLGLELGSSLEPGVWILALRPFGPLSNLKFPT